MFWNVNFGSLFLVPRFPGWYIYHEKEYSVLSPYLYPIMISRGSTLDEVWLSTLGLRALSLSLMSQWSFLYPCSINPPPGGLYRSPLFLLHLHLLHLRRLSNDARMSDDIYIILRLGGGEAMQCKVRLGKVRLSSNNCIPCSTCQAGKVKWL